MKFKKELILFFFSVLIITSISCSRTQVKDINNTTENRTGYPFIQFDTTYYDFGTLIQGEQAAYTFKFKNTGNSDLLILDAFSTCGCTVPSFSSEPIKPGEKGKIDVVFNSEGKRGLQYKTVTLKLNTKIKEKSLTIKANVIDNNYKS